MPKRRFAAESIAPILGAVVALIGSTVLVGWATGGDVLKSVAPGLFVMIPNTAMLFAVAGLSLWLQTQKQLPNRPSILVGRVMGGAVFLFGALLFIERLAEVDLGIDLVLFGEAVSRYPFQPAGRPATNSALSFVLAGLALIALGAKTHDRARPARWFATLGFAVSGLALAGYLYGAQSLYRFDPSAGMAFMTAAAFTLLHLGIIFAKPGEGDVSLVLGDDLAARIVRRLIPTIVALPLITGWLWQYVMKHSLLSVASGVAIFAVVMVGALIASLIKSARVIRATDRERERVLRLERKARAEADAASEVKGQFLATMSHELRTPLNAIIGYASLLHDGIAGPLNDQQAEHIRRLSLSAKHLLSLIEQVLTLSRVEAGRIDLSLSRVSIPGFIDEVVAIAQPLASQKGLRLEVDVPAGLSDVSVDVGRVRQILVNLLGNAVKFTERGTVGLFVRCDPEYLCFAVTDTGIGISEEHARRIFEPFWQADASRTRRAEGTGLGLSVSRQLAEAMGGDILLSSMPGVGSTFTLRLPFAAHLPTIERVAPSASVSPVRARPPVG